MQQLNIHVLGMNRLRKFKYNAYTPQFEIVAGKGIDWFDLTIRVSYGEQVVPLQELRKAIVWKQDHILLGDGRLGMLPKEWIEKYGLLMRMGQMKEGELKLPAIHWTLLEELGASSSDGAAGSGALQKELGEKKERLKTIATAKEWPVPLAVQARLRDYQLGGFQWMCLLDDLGWGGGLADDMGLGKTWQKLSFLPDPVEKYTDDTHLVVLP